jgi:hypothetical protein
MTIGYDYRRSSPFLAFVDRDAGAYLAAVRLTTEANHVGEELRQFTTIDGQDQPAIKYQEKTVIMSSVHSADDLLTRDPYATAIANSNYECN